MRIFSVKHKIRALVILSLITVAAYASIMGPEPRYTGAPGDLGNCTTCHDDNTANTGSGSVTLGSIPSVYEPGEKYRITVTVRQSNRQRYGFQLTAIDRSGNRAGTFQAVASDTQINPLTGAGGRQYIQHRQSGTLPNGNNQRTWQVDWTAPGDDVGFVRFYVAGNAANGSGDNRGDFIYTANSLSESETTVVNVDLTSDPAGMNLVPGSTFPITWAATNPSNVDSFELRYSTDDGMTFPISNLIATVTDGGATGFEWAVPDKQTNQGRIRLKVTTESNATPIEIVSARFSINGSGGGTLPVITGVRIKSKKLFIDGENFQMGAKVWLNNVSQKTNNEADFSHTLRCKKSGNLIMSGVPVSLKVVNPDGSESAVFEYTRP